MTKSVDPKIAEMNDWYELLNDVRDVGVLKRIGIRHLEQEAIFPALPFLLTAFQFDSDDIETRVRLTEALARLGLPQLRSEELPNFETLERWLQSIPAGELKTLWQNNKSMKFIAAWGRAVKSVRVASRWQVLGGAAEAESDHDFALSCAARSLALEDREKRSWETLCRNLLRRGYFGAAAHCVRKMQGAIGAPESDIGELLQSFEEYGAYHAIVELLENHASSWTEWPRPQQFVYANALKLTGRLEEAVRIADVLSSAPRLTAREFNQLAEQFARLVDAGRFVDLMDRCPEGFMRRYPPLRWSRGYAELRRGNDEAAFDNFKQALDGGLSDNQRSQCLFAMSEVLDRSGNVDDAFAHAKEANDIMYQAHQGVFDLDNFKARIAVIDKALEEDVLGNKIDMGDQFVLFVGFPRSGTTLLDNALSRHKQVVVIEEKNIFLRALLTVRETLNDLPETDLALIEVILADHGEKLADAYVKIVSEEVGGIEKGMIYVDKLPLDIIWAPVLERVFSGLKVIVSLRHPYDVLLSNFFQAYALNAEMIHMTSLSRIDDLYRRVFDLFFKYSDRFECQPLFVKYEDLTQRTQDTLQSVADYLGVDFDEGMLQPEVAAKAKLAVNTPSFRRVTGEIDTASLFRHRRYEQVVDFQSFPGLKKYVAKLGY